ncbi:hypothetical protein SAMN05444166_0659 [Singulisphaera sp. GP187]|uniref:hypothetical protein n=1 Tax=Singulisphaera sp. GP187 TaxID=1882752 RepID=UPI000928344A|nr:hypothetical protein [Singulisphaera sp. GP187]SIN75570.1 hypothetical protein SAMN05444166_0659 [Singulisphaera sp. GP187]
METTRTVVCKLAPRPEQASEIDATLKAFALACDFAAESARSIGSTNKVKVQHACYEGIRSQFGLSANLAIRATARAWRGKSPMTQPASLSLLRRPDEQTDSRPAFPAGSIIRLPPGSLRVRRGLDKVVALGPVSKPDARRARSLEDRAIGR